MTFPLILFSLLSQPMQTPHSQRILVPWLLLGVILLSGVCPELSARTVTDQLGRTLEVPDTPRRIVSLAPSITEMVFFLGGEDRLVGVSRQSDYPEGAKALPQVGPYINPDLERIVSLRPDLCIATKDGNPKAIVDKLQAFGIPVYGVNPQSLDGMLATLEGLGTLLGMAADTRGRIDRLKERVDAIDRLTRNVPGRPKVFLQIGIAPIVSAGSDSFIHEILTRAGGKNLAGTSKGYPRFSEEEVLGLSPDIIIITSMEQNALFEKVKAGWMGWSDLPATRTGRIYIEDSNLLDRVGPRLVDGLELMTQLIHPEFFRAAP